MAHSGLQARGLGAVQSSKVLPGPPGAAQGAVAAGGMWQGKACMSRFGECAGVAGLFGKPTTLCIRVWQGLTRGLANPLTAACQHSAPALRGPLLLQRHAAASAGRPRQGATAACAAGKQPAAPARPAAWQPRPSKPQAQHPAGAGSAVLRSAEQCAACRPAPASGSGSRQPGGASGGPGSTAPCRAECGGPGRQHARPAGVPICSAAGGAQRLAPVGQRQQMLRCARH